MDEGLHATAESFLEEVQSVGISNFYGTWRASKVKKLADGLKPEDEGWMELSLPHPFGYGMVNYKIEHKFDPIEGDGIVMSWNAPDEPDDESSEGSCTLYASGGFVVND